MIKHYCDCCGKEIQGNGNVFHWLCHLTDTANGKVAGYVDGDGQSVSGREDKAELCNGCYNEIVVVSVKKYYEFKRKHNVKY